MRKKLFLLVLFSVVFSFSFFLPPPTLAQSKAGINIGTKYDDLDRAINIVKPGGWIVVIAGGTGDCTKLQDAVTRTNNANVNLIIRGHLNNSLQPADALAWTATLGKLVTTKKLYFMPWNEPNQAGSLDWTEPSTLVAYTNTLIKALNDSGLRGGKIGLLSPMLNQTWVGGTGDFETYVNRLKTIKGSYFNEFDGVAMNLYDISRQICGTELCATDRHFNPKLFPQLLSFMGASGKPAYGVESGTAGENFYWKTPPNSSSPLYNFVQKFNNEADPQMFAIPSYDLGGEVGHQWSLFNPMDTTNLIASMPKGDTTPASFDQTVFDAWLNNLTQDGTLVSCGACGYAHKQNPGLCVGSGSPGPISSDCDPRQKGERSSRPVPCQACNITNKMTASCATSFTVKDKVSWQRKDGTACTLNDPMEHKVETTWGGTITIDPSTVTIPFVGLARHENGQWRDPITGKATEGENTHLADYFDGTSEYYQNYRKSWLDGVNYAGVLRKLTPMGYQDWLKTRMIERAKRSLTTTANFEGKIHDYKITYRTRVCWDMPLVYKAVYALFNAHLSIFQKIGINIPDLTSYCLFANSLWDFQDGPIGVEIPSPEAYIIMPVYLALSAYNLTSIGHLLPISVRFLGNPEALPPSNPLDLIGFFTNLNKGTKKLSEIDGHYPPSPSDPDYATKWLAWKNTFWGQIWEAVPMTSREDTEGRIMPYLGSRPEDTFVNIITDPVEAQKNLIEKVPHLARLYESSRLVAQALTLYPLSKTAFSLQGATDLASEQPQESTLLASSNIEQPNPPITAAPQPSLDLTLVLPSDTTPGNSYQLDAIGRVNLPSTCGDFCDVEPFNVTYSFNGSTVGGCSLTIPRFGISPCANWDPWRINDMATCTSPSKTFSLGDVYTISVFMKSLRGYKNPCVGPLIVSASCSMKLTANGWETNCGAVPPPTPSCKQGPAQTVNKCEKPDAITDDYVGDRLCCNPIEFKLTAKDVFNNDQYESCEIKKCCAWMQDPHDPSKSVQKCQDKPDCDATNCDISTGPDECKNGGCRDFKCKLDVNPRGCEYIDPVEVSRDVGVALSHPYLSKIWEQTAGLEFGVFNLFRPTNSPEFPQTPAYSKIINLPVIGTFGDIKYGYRDGDPPRYSGNTLPGQPGYPPAAHNDGSVSPASGKFYFPYLGGIQQSKQWVVNTFKAFKK